MAFYLISQVFILTNSKATNVALRDVRYSFAIPYQFISIMLCRVQSDLHSVWMILIENHLH